MRLLYQIPLRVRSVFRKQDADRDLDEELQFHLESQIDEYAKQGMVPRQARCAALQTMGRYQQVKEECRHMRNVNFIENVMQDVHFGVRMLRRNPGFSVLAILCLVLGIGANAAVFSWIEGILLRPFPMVAGQDRLMALTGTNRATPGHDGLSWPDFQDLQRNCTHFDAFIVAKIMGATLSIGDRAQVVTGSVVSSNYFDALSVRPILGRGFESEDDYGRNSHPVVVIGYHLWQDRFHGDPNIIGKTQMLAGQSHVIVGVAPKGFEGTFVGWAMQFWVPVSMQERFVPGGYMLEDRGATWIEAFARLKPGVTPDQAQAEISAVANRLEEEYPASNRGRGFRLYPLWETPFNNAGTLLPTLGIALGVVVFVLLIVCANVSNLLLVKAFGRRHEMTVRLSLGAGRSRLLQQLLTEGLLLSGIAAAGGLIVAHWCRNLLVLLLPRRGGRVMYLPGELDWRVVALSVVVCLLATILLGMVPGLHTWKLDLASALKAESGGVLGKRRTRSHSSLVLVQVALSFVLLVGSGLLLKSLRAVQSTDPGFSTRVVATNIDTRVAGYDKTRNLAFQDALLERLQAIPGIQSAAFSRIGAFTYGVYSSSPIVVDGYINAPGEQPIVDYNQITPDYLTTMGIPLMSGRQFTRADDENASPAAIVNEAMAVQFWHGADPIGRRIQVNGRWLQVVGVARQAKYSTLIEARKPFFYVPMRQSIAGNNLYIRTSLPPSTSSSELVRQVHALDANLAPGEIVTMQEEIDRSTAVQRIAVNMLGAFGMLALILAAVGIYGVMSYVVSQSTREFGLRMALGARGSDLLRLVISRGMLLTTAGIVIGGFTAIALSRLLGYLLYKVSPRDVVTFADATVIMVLAALAACLLPAWRAARIDPVRALRG